MTPRLTNRDAACLTAINLGIAVLALAVSLWWRG